MAMQRVWRRSWCVACPPSTRRSTDASRDRRPQRGRPGTGRLARRSGLPLNRCSRSETMTHAVVCHLEREPQRRLCARRLCGRTDQVPTRASECTAGGGRSLCRSVQLASAGARRCGCQAGGGDQKATLGVSSRGPGLMAQFQRLFRPAGQCANRDTSRTPLNALMDNALN